MRIFENRDCMEGMVEYPDNYFDLAIVDPPYGIGEFQQSDANYKPVKWNDQIPNNEYFKLLKQKSKRQIIWGAIYYNCFSGGAIVWDKENPHPAMSRCEIASKSFERKVDYVNIRHYGFHGDKENFHPCGKPVALYRWLLQNYAKPGDLILDTHVGGASSLIACIELGLDYVDYELDPDYFKAATERIRRFEAQGDLFRKPENKVKQSELNLK